MTISEKVAYLKGMLAGMELEDTSKEAKLIAAILDVLEDMGHSIEDLEEDTDLLGEDLDALSEDLEDLEDFLYEEEDEDDYDDEDDDYFFEVECPECNEELVIDGEIIEAGEIECPNCHNKFALDLSDEGDLDDED